MRDYEDFKPFETGPEIFPDKGFTHQDIVEAITAKGHPLGKELFVEVICKTNLVGDVKFCFKF